MFRPNTLFYTDGYKVGHKRMLAPGTTKLYGSWIPRSVKYAPKNVKKIVSFGQQLVVKWLHDEFEEKFFNAVELEYTRGIDETGRPYYLPTGKVINKGIEPALKFAKDMSLYLGMEYDGKHFEELWNLGYLPIKIKSLPEGIETNPNIPHMTFIDTVDGFAWLTLYLETIISSLAWKPSTSATIALQYRRNLVKWVMKTDPNNAWLIDFLAHDFSARGLSPWDMLSSGLGHATSFRGSDTLITIPGARYFYNEPEDEVCINSVNASEHSVSTTKIFTVGEKQMIIDWCKEFPTGILSIVADTFDLWKLITEYLTDPEVKELIMKRDGKLVIRPDSGNPVDIVCGLDIPEYDTLEEAISAFEDILSDSQIHGEMEFDCDTEVTVKVGNEYYKLDADDIDWNRYDKQYYFIETYNINSTKLNYEPKFSGVIELLWNIFGGTINEQGYKVLDPHIGAIYGDSITLERQEQIYERLAAKGFASTNIVLGVGSFTYQYNTRDTLGFAAKGAWFEVEEEFWASPESLEPGVITKSYNIYKDPVTDDGTKKSLKGLLQVIQTENPHVEENGEIWVKTECTPEEESTGLLQVIYENGKFYNQTTLTEIREKIKNLS